MRGLAGRGLVRLLLRRVVLRLARALGRSEQRVQLVGFAPFETDEGFEPDYHVVEELPRAVMSLRQVEAPVDAAALYLTAVELPDPDADTRAVTLRIDLDSVTVHDVQRVMFETVPHKVRRYRYQQKFP